MGRLDQRDLKDWFEDVLHAQGPLKWTGSEGKCRCPFHEDRAPSFSVNCEKGVWKCHAGCGEGGIKDLASRLGVPAPWSERSNNKPSVISTREYNYFDSSGVLRYQAVRQDMSDGKKKIWQRKPDDRGGWVNNTKGIKPLPYRLPELLAKIGEGKTIIIAEGEKCVDALCERGFAATTNHGGAGKWRSEHTECVPPGTQAVILPDADIPGMKHAAQVALSLYEHGCKVKIVSLGYEMADAHGKDVYDWFAAGHTSGELIAAIKETPYWSTDDIRELEDIPFPEDDEPKKRRKTENSIDFPDIGLRGAVKATIRNLYALLGHYGITIRYNEIGKDTLFSFRDGNPYSMDNNENACLGKIMSLLETEDMPVRHLDQFLYEVADTNRVNPVKDWITSKPWDGADRILPICDTVSERQGFPVDLKELFIEKWLLSAVAAACHDSSVPFMTRGVLTLSGNQYIGKGRWFLSLAPRDWVKDGHLLDPSNKDLVREAISHWIVELGELETTFGKGIGKLKAFLTKESDQIRIPFARGLSRFPRRTVFGASVNKPDFLADATGNSRFWVIPVERIDYKHNIDTQQLFAQLHVMYKGGAQWWLTEEENKRLESQNEAHQERDEVYDTLAGRVDWSRFSEDLKSGYVDWLTPTDVLLQICKIDYPTSRQRKSCASLLRELTGLKEGKRGHRQAARYPIPTRRLDT
ncbi:MAG: hypothetical protein LBS45_00115 [Synergistaceae bacterium]|jgi:hypothetical protein|nr:hypothetical protein [Synergistaceae bacterium]